MIRVGWFFVGFEGGGDLAFPQLLSFLVSRSFTTPLGVAHGVLLVTKLLNPSFETEFRRHPPNRCTGRLNVPNRYSVNEWGS